MSRIYPLIVFLFLTISCSKFTNSHSSETKWISIFDGKTLDKWELVGRDSLKLPYFWKVDNQILYCKTSGDKAHQGSWLVFHEKLSDFELKFKFRSNPNLKGNSGIQFRSQFDLEQNKMQVPQIDIHPPAPFRTGLIYDETDGVKHWLYPVTESWKLASFPMPKDWVYYKDSSKWNEMYLYCRGTRIITKINNVVISDYDGAGVLNDSVHTKLNVGMNGTLAIQLHKKHDIDIQFKDIYLKK